MTPELGGPDWGENPNVRFILRKGSSERDHYRALAIHLESGQDRAMARNKLLDEGRKSLVGIKDTLWKTRAKRLIWGFAAFVFAYDQWSGGVSQLLPFVQLPALGSLAMGGSHLLPLWGWLLVLLTLVVVSILDYVARQVRVMREESTAKALAMTAALDTMRAEISDVQDRASRALAMVNTALEGMAQAKDVRTLQMHMESIGQFMKDSPAFLEELGLLKAHVVDIRDHLARLGRSSPLESRQPEDNVEEA